MSATRLLVLGVVRGYGRAHGYRIGTDLMSWDTAEWANVKWGSIYHALRSLTLAGLLLDHDDVPGRTDYELTERGEAEYLRLLREAVRRPQARPDQLGAALAMLPSLPREEAVRLLRERLAALEEIRDKARAQLDGWTDPPHWSELYGLWQHAAAGGVEWTAGLIGRLEAGAYAMAGEPGSPGRALCGVPRRGRLVNCRGSPWRSPIRERRPGTSGTRCSPTPSTASRSPTRWT